MEKNPVRIDRRDRRVALFALLAGTRLDWLGAWLIERETAALQRKASPQTSHANPNVFGALLAGVSTAKAAKAAARVQAAAAQANYELQSEILRNAKPGPYAGLHSSANQSLFSFPSIWNGNHIGRML